MSRGEFSKKAIAKVIVGLFVAGYVGWFILSLSPAERYPIIGIVGIYAILAMSLNVICGMTGLLQLGHAGFFAAGAYAAGLFSIYATMPQLGWANFLLGAVVAMTMAAIFSLLIGLPCLRLSGDYLAIATLAFGEILRLILTNISFPGGKMFPQETIGEATGIYFTEFPDEVWPNFPDFSANYSQWWVIWIFAGITYIFFRNIKRSAVGRALMCIREDEIAAQAMGINIPHYKMLAFVMSAAFAGLAGALFFHKEMTIAPGDFSLMRSIEILLMVVLGGLGSFSGSAAAAVLLGVTPEILRRVDLNGYTWLPEPIRTLQLGEYYSLLYALLLIILIRMAPDGFLGMNELPKLRKESFPSKEGEKDD